uniref:Ubiquitin-protein ligase E3C n=1 Tax=Xenopsylla cheopis TaxID=163159 RepID=A0A6M2E0P6_XENCH
MTTKNSWSGNKSTLLLILSRGFAMTAEDTDLIVPPLTVFCELFSILISTLHDGEFSSAESIPFTLPELIPVIGILKDVCLGLVELAFPDSRPSIPQDYQLAVRTKEVIQGQKTENWIHLFKVSVQLLRQLHMRDLRMGFCPSSLWIASDGRITVLGERPSDVQLKRARRGYRPFRRLRTVTRDQIDIGPPASVKEVRFLTALRELPFAIPFATRVRVLQGLLNAERALQHGDAQEFLRGPAISIKLRRSHLYEDAFDKLSLENEPNLRLKMRVQLVNAAGLEEAGVDGGGMFREVLSELIHTAFDPNRGFFILAQDRSLYPNPGVSLIVEDFTKHYYFIGRLLGKALFENLLVDLPLAEFFLCKLVGPSIIDAHHLASLDPILHRSLISLKNYTGDVNDLGLDFTVVTNDLGETKTEELKAGGSNITVNTTNRIEYIHLMADYKLNRQIRAQFTAFRQGLDNVLPVEWLHMFNFKELQVLISGSEVPVDIDDLKRNTSYTGGYNESHPTIQMFWRVIKKFNDAQKKLLLKFVTSCSRPPLLGFKDLEPPFCIQLVGSADRLPTASTCINLLKLPEFSEESVLHDRLLYAIQSGSGFELS